MLLYSNPQHMARGGWSWYTGSAGWIYQVCIEDIIGLKKHDDYFLLDPVLPKDWALFEMEYNYMGTKYNIQVEKVLNKGLYLNGSKLEDKKVPLKENAGEVEINLII